MVQQPTTLSWDVPGAGDVARALRSHHRPAGIMGPEPGADPWVYPQGDAGRVGRWGLCRSSSFSVGERGGDRLNKDLHRIAFVRHVPPPHLHVRCLARAIAVGR
jgi:hypothetical protein